MFYIVPIVTRATDLGPAEEDGAVQRRHPAVVARVDHLHPPRAARARRHRARRARRASAIGAA